MRGGGRRKEREGAREREAGGRKPGRGETGRKCLCLKNTAFPLDHLKPQSRTVCDTSRAITSRPAKFPLRCNPGWELRGSEGRERPSALRVSPGPALPRAARGLCPRPGIAAAAPGFLPLSPRPAAPSLSLRVGKLSSRCGGLPLPRAPEEEEEEGGRGRVNALCDLTSDFRCSAHPPPPPPPMTDTRTHALGPLSFFPHPRARRGHRKGQMSGCTLSSAVSTLTLPAGRGDSTEIPAVSSSLCLPETGARSRCSLAAGCAEGCGFPASSQPLSAPQPSAGRTQ